MPRIPPRCWPRLGFYGGLLSLAALIGGHLAAATIQFAVVAFVLDALAESLWWVNRFTPRTTPSPATTAAGTALLAALAAGFLAFHLAASGGSAAALQSALMVSMVALRHPLAQLEHNRRVAEERAAQDRNASSR
ncbi:hypothetical protein GALL_385900 [mine drainage metagenome]|jgi:hypothetical protein|uniref:Uncharacterized protein n=1 Tax=mine drainage metagenome TaxID=410659 RepID=A0A1J5Q7P3_9ZZZZ